MRVYRLITEDTMEKKMVEKQAMKLKLDSMIIQKGRAAGRTIHLPFTQLWIYPQQQPKNLWGQGSKPLGIGRLIPKETLT